MPKITRALVALALLVASFVAWGTTPGQAADYVVVNSINKTYLAAGGEAKLGTPVENESLLVIGGHRTWGQTFTDGVTVWDSATKKGKAYPYAARIRIDAAPNFRPIVGVRGVYRSDDLQGGPGSSKINPLDTRILVELGITRSVALNSGGDPVISTIRNYSDPISTASSKTQTYEDLASSGDRFQVGKALTTIAENTTGATLLHCTAGKDRSGTTSYTLQMLNGVSVKTAEADYMLTRTYSKGDVSLTWLHAFDAEVKRKWGSYDGYVLASGVSQANLAKLKALH